MPMFKKHAGKIFLAAAVVLLVGSFIIAGQSKRNADEGVVINENIKGNPEAGVVLTEYSDFECAACGQFSPVVKEIMEEFGDSVRLEYKHYPLVSIHPFATPAAIAAEAAGQQGKFWEMHDKLFENQAVWPASTDPTGLFIQYAKELELDVETFRRHLRSNLIAEKVKSEFNEARSKNYTGTPTFELNGSRMQFDTFQEFRDQIAVAVKGDTGDFEVEAAQTTGSSDVKFGF